MPSYTSVPMSKDRATRADALARYIHAHPGQNRTQITKAMGATHPTWTGPKVPWDSSKFHSVLRDARDRDWPIRCDRAESSYWMAQTDPEIWLLVEEWVGRAFTTIVRTYRMTPAHLSVATVYLDALFGIIKNSQFQRAKDRVASL